MDSKSEQQKVLWQGIFEQLQIICKQPERYQIPKGEHTKQQCLKTCEGRIRIEQSP